MTARNAAAAAAFVNNGVPSLFPEEASVKLLSREPSLEEKEAPSLARDRRRKLRTDRPQSLPYLSSPRNRCNIFRAQTVVVAG